MVLNRFPLIDEYNKVDILLMQGVDGGLRAAPHLLRIHMPLRGSRRDTRRGCATARTPRSPFFTDNSEFVGVINMTERSCDVI